MKVPRINLGVQVSQPNYSAILTIDQVDHINKKFYASHPGPPVPSFGWFTFDQYTPAHTWDNFIRALSEWDYYWQMSDDPRVLEKGQEMKNSLDAFYRKLIGRDNYHITQKIVEIVVMSAQPR